MSCHPFLWQPVQQILRYIVQAAKMARYAKAPRILPDALFVVFMLSWIASRCIYFPFFIIRSTLFESPVSTDTHCHTEHDMNDVNGAAQWSPGRMTWVISQRYCVPPVCSIATDIIQMQTSPLCPTQEAAKRVGVSMWPHYHIFNVFLIFLFCLHVFWCAYVVCRFCNTQIHAGQDSGSDQRCRH